MNKLKNLSLLIFLSLNFITSVFTIPVSKGHRKNNLSYSKNRFTNYPRLTYFGRSTSTLVRPIARPKSYIWPVQSHPIVSHPIQSNPIASQPTQANEKFMPSKINRPKSFVEVEIEDTQTHECSICMEDKHCFINLSCCNNHNYEDKKICKKCFKTIICKLREERDGMGSAHPNDFYNEDLEITMQNRPDLKWKKFGEYFYFDAGEEYWRIVPENNDFRDLRWIRKPKCPFCNALLKSRYYKKIEYP